MPTYQYTSPEQIAVHIIDDDGISRSSMLVSALDESVEILPYVPPPPAVPRSVTMRQARLALLGSGLLATVSTTINSLPSPQKEAAQIEWEYSQEVQRHNGFVSQLAPLLGLTDEQVDQLFITASQL